MRALLVLGFVALTLGGCKERPDVSQRIPFRRRPTTAQKVNQDVQEAQKKEEQRDDKVVEQAK